MEKIILAVAFLVSLFALPYWASVVVAVVYLSQGGNPLLVIAGGLLFDAVFGGFAYLYTALAVALSVTALYLRSALFE